MKIAILVHSKSGNTRKFADSLFEILSADGHNVNLTQLETTAPVKQGSVRDKQEISFSNLPDITDAEAVLFGGPVWAFGPSPVIVAAIRQLGNLKGKSTISFATMGFPIKGLGGKAAIRFMDREAGTKGAKVLPGGICSQMCHKLDGDITKETERISALLKVL